MVDIRKVREEHRQEEKGKSREEHHLIDADFSLNILETLLDDANKGSRRNQSSIDIRLTDVTLYTKCEGWVGEPWKREERKNIRTSKNQIWTLI